MEYIFGFIIQIAGIMLLAKLSWSLLRLLARQSVRPFRFVLTQIKRLLTPTSKRRPMAVPKAPGMPRLTSAFYIEPTSVRHGFTRNTNLSASSVFFAQPGRSDCVHRVQLRRGEHHEKPSNTHRLRWL